MATFNEKVFAVITSLIHSQDEVEWHEIVKAVTDSGIKVSNWLKVRGVLQFCIRERMIVRTSDLSIEKYVVLNNCDL